MKTCNPPDCIGFHAGAVEKTRTSTGFRPQRPQRCASTSSATTASSTRAREKRPPRGRWAPLAKRLHPCKRETANNLARLIVLQWNVRRRALAHKVNEAETMFDESVRYSCPSRCRHLSLGAGRAAPARSGVRPSPGHGADPARGNRSPGERSGTRGRQRAG